MQGQKRPFSVETVDPKKFQVVSWTEELNCVFPDYICWPLNVMVSGSRAFGLQGTDPGLMGFTSL